jgi:NADPH:quinone reductase-like Zn-dependent oxidoreductase
MAFTGRELRSKIDGDGKLVLSSEEVLVTDPADDEVVVRIEAAPINPSDLGLLLGPVNDAALETAKTEGSTLTLNLPGNHLSAVMGRIGQSLPVGNEGAGTVVATGKNAAIPKGKLVGMIGAPCLLTIGASRRLT